jgi:hypothetical protein
MCQEDTSLYALGDANLLTLGFAHRGIDDLENGNAEGRRLTSTGLGLRDRVTSFADLHNGTRLDSRW